LILIANIIAWPVAFYIMSRWLRSFAYRSSIDWWVFIISSFLALTIALITVSYQSIKSALTNPADILKYE
jgi:putative ABC transport system permease protein